MFLKILASLVIFSPSVFAGDSQLESKEFNKVGSSIAKTSTTSLLFIDRKGNQLGAALASHFVMENEASTFDPSLARNSIRRFQNDPENSKSYCKMITIDETKQVQVHCNMKIPDLKKKINFRGFLKERKGDVVEFVSDWGDTLRATLDIDEGDSAESGEFGDSETLEAANSSRQEVIN